MVASARLPVVGELFLGQDAADLLNSNARIWVSQDQRHTAHGQVRYQPWSRFWTSVGASYGTGLPVELHGETTATLGSARYHCLSSRCALLRFSCGSVPERNRLPFRLSCSTGSPQ